MATLGQRLRREREAKGVSLADIANQTRIGARLLKAIEEEDFEQLPGGIYNKAFLRQYVSFLGLDEEQALREYDLLTGSAQETPPSQQNLSPEAPASRDHSLALPWKLAALALIPIAAAALWLLSGRPDSPEMHSSQTSAALHESIPAPEAARTSAASPAAPSEPLSASTPPLPEDLVQTAEERPTFSEYGADELLLEISARSEVWLYITADGEESWQGILQPNQTRQVQAAESIRLTVGNAGGVELMLNGKPLGTLGRPGEVKRVSIAGTLLPNITP